MTGPGPTSTSHGRNRMKGRPGGDDTHFVHRAAVLISAVIIAAVLGGSVWMSTGAKRPRGPVLPGATPLEAEVRQLVDAACAKIHGEPEQPLHRMELALIYEANGLPDLAEAGYLDAIAVEGGVAQCWYHLALVRAQQEDIDGAIDAMGHAIRLEHPSCQPGQTTLRQPRSPAIPEQPLPLTSSAVNVSVQALQH